MKFTRRFFSILFMTSLLMACSKDGNDGAVGPQGAQGLAGAEGAQGSQGEQGEQGETGTANVIYSDWVDTLLGNNIMSSSAEFDIPAPEIDTDILNFGTILVYARRLLPDLTPQIYQLPIVFGVARQQSYYFVASGGNIEINVVANEEGEDVLDGSFLKQYRYVIVPGGIPSTGKSTSSLDYTKMTYEEIVAHFNIPE